MTGGSRLTRINEAIRQVISEAVGDLSDPRLGFVTVTGVDAARDLRNAVVYVSVLGDEDVRQSTLAALRSAHGVFQSAIARQVKLHHTPRLEFRYDDTLDSALRIRELLDSE